MKLFIITPLLCMLQTLNGQALFPVANHPYLSLEACSNYQEQPFRFLDNCAALAGCRKFQAGVMLDQRFLIPGLQSGQAVLCFPVSSGSMGVQIAASGDRLKNEWLMGLAYARDLGDKLDLGVKFNVYRVAVPDFFRRTAVYAVLGCIYHISNQLHSGVTVVNPVGATITTGKRGVIPRAFQLALGYDVSPSFFVGASVTCADDQPPCLLTSIRYRYSHRFSLKTGFESTGSSVYAGCSFIKNRMRFDIFISFHPLLGLSPGMMLMTNNQDHE